MKIKKFIGSTKEEATKKAEEELGINVSILEVNDITQKGIKSFFKSSYVEVLAAYDEIDERSYEAKDESINTSNKNEYTKSNVKPIDEINKSKDFLISIKDKTINEQKSKIKELEKKIKELETKIPVLEDNLTELSFNLKMQNNNQNIKYKDEILQVFFEALIKSGVNKEIATEILDELTLINDDLDVNFIMKVVYNKILNILGTPKDLEFNTSYSNNEAKVLVFFGPTGVGKTTTIAKITSDLVINKNMEVGLITSDTYRIAAVEQLKTYADILSIDVEVAYTSADLSIYYNKIKNNKDVILVDTSGRTHKNSENFKEVEKILGVLPKCQKFLVLSATTKFEDIKNIINSFSTISDFKIILTKVDETTTLGSILNISYVSDRKISYITFGQNIPDDIELMNPDKVTKSLLGLEGGF